MKRLSFSVVVLGLMAACSPKSEEPAADAMAEAPEAEAAAEEAPADEATPEGDMAMEKSADQHASQHEAYTSMFNPCFEGTEGLEGSVEFSWTYAGGKATEIKAGEHAENMAAPVTCMGEALAAADFAGHEDGMVTHVVTVNGDGTLSVSHAEQEAEAAPAEGEEAAEAAEHAEGEAHEEGH